MIGTKLNEQSVIEKMAVMRLASPAGKTNLASGNNNPLIASKGAGSVHVLRRRRGRGWEYLGYATWSCGSQSWVCGSWSSPVSADEAHTALEDMAWEG